MTGLVQFPAGSLSTGLTPSQTLAPSTSLIPASAGMSESSEFTLTISQFSLPTLTLTQFTTGTLP